MNYIPRRSLVITTLLTVSFSQTSFTVISQGSGNERPKIQPSEDFISIQKALKDHARRDRAREKEMKQGKKPAPKRTWRAKFLTGLISFSAGMSSSDPETECREDCVHRWLSPATNPPPEATCNYIDKHRSGSTSTSNYESFAREACGP